MQLEARRITKRHPGVIALDGVSALFRGGECHAVVGENGAGKSTLMRVLSGASQPDEGTLLLDDDAIVLSSPHAAQLLGIRMIHQELALVPDLTVADNILLGAEPSRRGILNRAYQDDLARTALVRLGQQHIDVHARPRDLSLAAQQMVEIAKAVAARTTMLILDEPTAILSLPETVHLFVVLNELRSSGVAIVYVSHRMDEVFELADRITVLRDGRLVSTAAIGELARADVVRDMVGRTLAEGYPPAIGATDKEVLRVEGLSSGLARNVSFRLCAGEAVALVGLVGSGRTDVLRAIFGAAPLVAGAMWLGGSPYAPRTPRDAIARGVALVPEDRKHLALIPDRVVRENISLATIGEYATHGVIQHNAERAAVREWTDTLGVRESATEARVDTLSGGNQQKTVFARSMLTDASVMLIDEPTRGVDVGAKSEIYDLIRAMTARGVAVILVSSELPEALGLADRVLAMRNGELVAELRGPDCTAGIVGPIILGETATAA